MRTDHRRPLAAYGLVALACALVMWQPSIGASVASRAPVVTLLADIGLSPSELLSRIVVGDLFNVSPVAAPEAELPAAEPDLAEDLFTPSQSLPDAGVDSAPSVALDAGLIGADGGRDPLGGGGSTPGVGPDEPDGGGTPGTDVPQGGKGTAPGSGHPGKGPKHKAAAHPGHGPKDKGAGHPGQGPKDKGDHPGKGPKDKGGHPGKGPKDKDKGKGKSQGNGPKHQGPQGRGPIDRA